jgi:hypothetical protein
MQDEAAEAAFSKCDGGGRANTARRTRNERGLSIECPVHALEYRSWIAVFGVQAEADCWFRNQSRMASR